MWQKFDEPFVLGPKQAAVFRDAAAFLSDMVGWEESENDCSDMGIAVFDNLSQGQKQVAILTVAKALLDPKVDPPTVTAALAGTVHAIYCELECLVELESDRNETSEPGETSIRQMVLDAVAELNYWKEVNDARGPGDKLIKPLSAKSKNREKWNDLIEVLRDEVLADYDFAMDGEIGDMDPDRGEELKEFMGIKADYFVAVVEDPGPERLAQIREENRRLLC